MRFRSLVLGALFTALAASTALGQAAGSGKNLTIVVGFGPGGGYDVWARLVGRHIGQFLPGSPNVIVQNMPGAGGYVAASWLYNIAPKDGSVIGLISRDVAVGPIIGAPGARFDATKMNWLGTPATDTNVCIANNNAAVQSVDDLMTKQLIVGDVGPGSGTRTYPNALNELLGTKFKLVSGFPSSADVFLAMERGEVDGICESLDSVTGKRPDWIKSGKVRILFQGGSEPNPHVKAPFVVDLAKTDDQKAAIRFLYAGQGIGRPFVAPPSLPADKLSALRDAFAKTMADPAFIEDAAKSKLEIEPKDGPHLEGLVRQIYASPQALVDKMKPFMQ
ncbi:MAG: efflux transporter protein [Hyphomicrobiales bacterium]|jgi:tripartite-type tricarboxylate transporter receptor subunit TctC|nr:efflux transporter protein [Hyphomicrobiales bacterium]